MITIRFITLRKTSNGYPVNLYININGKRLHFFTDIYVSNPDNLREGRVRRSEGDYCEKNLRLDRIMSEVSPLVYNNVDTDELRKRIPVILGHKQDIGDRLLIDHISDYISLLPHTRTRELYQGTIRKIKTFDSKVKPEDVTKVWLTGFEQFCAKTMSVNGYGIHMRNIRAVFNYLIQEGVTEYYPFRKYKIKKEATVHRVLNEKQLRLIKYTDTPKFALEYRDMFMLSLYLIGINLKDLVHIIPDQVQNGRLVYHRFKTKKLYSIKMEPEALELLQKYKGEKYLLNCMDRYRNHMDYLHHMNDGLKKLGMEYKNGAGYTKGSEPICKELSSYWARHTWATIAYGLGISKDVISQALGHSNGLSVTDIYIEYDREKVDEANRKVIDYINGL